MRERDLSFILGMPGSSAITCRGRMCIGVLRPCFGEPRFVARFGGHYVFSGVPPKMMSIFVFPKWPRKLWQVGADAFIPGSLVTILCMEAAPRNDKTHAPRHRSLRKCFRSVILAISATQLILPSAEIVMDSSGQKPSYHAPPPPHMYQVVVCRNVKCGWWLY